MTAISFESVRDLLAELFINPAEVTRLSEGRFEFVVKSGGEPILINVYDAIDGQPAQATISTMINRRYSVSLGCVSINELAYQLGGSMMAVKNRVEL